MTVTDVPTHRVEVDEAQLLFEEARQRRKRRWLITGIATFAFVILFGIVVGLLAIRVGVIPLDLWRTDPPFLRLQR